MVPASASGVSCTGGCGVGLPPGTGASTTYLSGTNTALPVWLKLVRSDTVVWGYVSSDGVSWALIGNAMTTLSNTTTQLGPVVTSHDPSALNTATFDNVEVRVPQ